MTRPVRPVPTLLDGTSITALAAAIAAALPGGGGGSVDREVVVSTYRVTTAFSGASIGDTLTATRVLDVAGATATQVGATVWYNETTAAALGAAPSAANIALTGATALTDAQLRAAAVPVSGPLTDAQLRAANVNVALNGVGLNTNVGTTLPASLAGLAVNAFNRLFDGTNWAVARGDTTGAFSVLFNNLVNVGTSTALTSAATYTGASRDSGIAPGTPSRYAYYNAFALANVAGTMRIELSNDGSTWRRATTDQAVAADTPVFLSVPVVARYYRTVFVNGATGQTTFLCNDSWTIA